MTNSTDELKKLSLDLFREKKRRKIAKKGRENLSYLVQEILYPRTVYPHFKPLGQIHTEVEEFLRRILQKQRTHPGKKIIGILLLPREHLKSTMVTIAWLIQRIILNPNIRIFLTNEKLDNSKKFLKAISDHFERNELFKYLYGDFVNRNEQRWTQIEITTSKRTLTGIKEPTIQTGSLETSLVSTHYDLVLADDLVSRLTVMTREQVEKGIQYWKDLMSLATDNAILLDIGTRWDHSDLHGWLLDQAKAHPDEYEVLVMGCYEEAVLENGERVIMEPRKIRWPEAKSIEGFEQLRNQDAYDFSCLYLNDPTDDATAAFKRSWFNCKYYTPELEEKAINTFITFDNAPSTKAGTDFIGCIVNSVDTQNNWYLRYVKRYKLNTPQLVDEIFRLHSEFKPQIIGVEQKAFEDLIKPYIEIKNRKLGRSVYVVELKDKGLRKEDRIKGRLQGRFNQGSIFFNAHPLDDTGELITELLKFPKYRYDDLADALQYQDEIASPPHEEVKAESKKPSDVIKKDFETAYQRLQEKKYGPRYGGETI